MRPPIRASEPLRRGVSMRMRGEAASAASRDCAGEALGSAGDLRRRAGRGLRRGAGLRRGRLLLRLRLLLLLRDLLLLLQLRNREQILPSDQDDAGQHDGEQQVLLVVHINDPYRDTRARLALPGNRNRAIICALAHSRPEKPAVAPAVAALS